jgi:heptosyltransferase-1
MKLLLIKTSSIGDLLHCFPALTDARRAVPGLSVTWVVE